MAEMDEAAVWDRVTTGPRQSGPPPGPAEEPHFRPGPPMASSLLEEIDALRETAARSEGKRYYQSLNKRPV